MLSRMRLLSVLLICILALALTACAEQGGSVSSATPFTTLTAAVPASTATQPGAQPTLSSTETTPVADQSTPASTSTPPAAVETPAAPVSFLASSMLKAPLLSPTQLEPAANITGFIFDATNGFLTYLLVTGQPLLDNQTVLAPWLAVQVVLPANPALSPDGQGEAFQLAVPAEAVQSAPTFDPQAFAENPPPVSDWDAAFRDYWTGLLVDGALPVTGEDQPASSPLLVDSAPYAGIDYPVLNMQNQALGRIKDFVIDSTGNLQYALLKPAAELNLGGSVVPVQWRDLAWHPEPGQFFLDQSPAALQSAPTVDPADLPDMTIPGWDQSWQQAWADLAAQPQPTQPVLSQSTAQPDQATLTPEQMPGKASQMIGAAVVTVQGEPLGALQDLLFMPQGQLAFFVLSTPGGQFVPIPRVLLSWDSAQNLFVFQEAPEVLQQAPAFQAEGTLTQSGSWTDQAVQYWTAYVDLADLRDNLDAAGDQPSLIAASRVLGSKVFDASQQQVASAAGLLLSPEGQITYLVLQQDNQLRPVPWEIFAFDYNSGSLLYTDDTQRLQSAPSFDSLDAIPNTTENWDKQLRQYWGLPQN